MRNYLFIDALAFLVVVSTLAISTLGIFLVISTISTLYQ